MVFMYHDWCSLSIVTRMKLADKFGIKKTSSVHVADNVVQQDGYSVKDVERALNVPAIQSYLETTEDNLQKLWPLLIDKIEGKTPLAKAEEKIVESLNTGATSLVGAGGVVLSPVSEVSNVPSKTITTKTVKGKKK